MIHVTSSMFMKNGGTCRALDATGDGDEKRAQKAQHRSAQKSAPSLRSQPSVRTQNSEVSEKSERKTPPRAPAPLISYNSLDCAGRTRSSNVQAETR